MPATGGRLRGAGPRGPRGRGDGGTLRGMEGGRGGGLGNCLEGLAALAASTWMCISEVRGRRAGIDNTLVIPSLDGLGVSSGGVRGLVGEGVLLRIRKGAVGERGVGELARTEGVSQWTQSELLTGFAQRCLGGIHRSFIASKIDQALCDQF